MFCDVPLRPQVVVDSDSGLWSRVHVEEILSGHVCRFRLMLVRILDVDEKEKTIIPGWIGLSKERQVREEFRLFSKDLC